MWPDYKIFWITYSKKQIFSFIVSGVTALNIMYRADKKASRRQPRDLSGGTDCSTLSDATIKLQSEILDDVRL